MTLTAQDPLAQENQAVGQVVDRLAGTYPEVSRDDISTIVAEEHEKFAGNPIRDYVPVLVERQVKVRLRAARA